jgi:hypothetical protein
MNTLTASISYTINHTTKWSIKKQLRHKNPKQS